MFDRNLMGAADLLCRTAGRGGVQGLIIAQNSPKSEKLCFLLFFLPPDSIFTDHTNTRNFGVCIVALIEILSGEIYHTPIIMYHKPIMSCNCTIFDVFFKISESEFTLFFWKVCECGRSRRVPEVVPVASQDVDPDTGPESPLSTSDTQAPPLLYCPKDITHFSPPLSNLLLVLWNFTSLIPSPLPSPVSLWLTAIFFPGVK